MFPVIQLGPFSLPAPGLFLLLGVWVGLTIAERLAPRFRANPNQLYNLVFTVLIAGVIGARLSYVVQHLDAFIKSPLSLFSLNPGLLDPWGGAAVGLIAGLIYIQRKQIPLWPTLDALTPFLAVMWIALGLSNLASGKAFGMETQLPWGIDLWGAIRHPTQIYQILAGAVILGLIWPRSSAANAIQRIVGETFWAFLALSAGAWMMIEAFRGDSILLLGGFRSAQIIAWILLAFSLWGWGYVKNKASQSGELV